MMRKLHLFCYLLLSSVALSIAQWTTDPTGLAVCKAGGLQKNVQVVSDSAGGAFVVWQDQRDDAADVYTQYIDANGIIGTQKKEISQVKEKSIHISFECFGTSCRRSRYRPGAAGWLS